MKIHKHSSQINENKKPKQNMRLLISIFLTAVSIFITL